MSTPPPIRTPTPIPQLLRPADFRGPRRDKQTRVLHKTLIAEMYAERVKQKDMAARLGITEGQVSQDLKVILAEWADRRTFNIDLAKREELNRINRMEERMWERYERSLTQPVKSQSHRTIEGEFVYPTGAGKTAPVERKDKRYMGQEKELRHHLGDMEAWHSIEWCVERRCKLLGLDAPAKIAPTNPEGDKEYGLQAKQDLIQMIEDIATRQQAAKERVAEDEAERAASRTPRQLMTGTTGTTGAASAAPFIEPFIEAEARVLSPDGYDGEARLEQLDRLRDDPVAQVIKRRREERAQAAREEAETVHPTAPNNRSWIEKM